MVNVIKSQVEEDGGAGVKLVQYVDGRNAGKFAAIVWVLSTDGGEITEKPIMGIKFQTEAGALADYAALTGEVS